MELQDADEVWGAALQRRAGWERAVEHVLPAIPPLWRTEPCSFVNFELDMVPSGYVKIALENGQLE